MIPTVTMQEIWRFETIVSAIKKCIRSSDKIIRFWRGDEFLLVTPGIHNNIFNKKTSTDTNKNQRG